VCIVDRGHNPSIYRYCPEWKALHIRLVCRQIHEETTDFIFERVRVIIDMGGVNLLEGKLTGLTFLEANWKRLRSFKLDVRPPIFADVTESQLVDIEKFLRNLVFSPW